MRTSSILLGCVLLSSCTGDCGSLQKKADGFYQEYGLICKRDTKLFIELSTLIDSLILIHPKHTLPKNYVRYSLKPSSYSDGGLNKQNEQVSKFLTRIRCESVLIDYEMSNDSIPLVLVYPSNLDKYNLVESCPGFSAELIYFPNKKIFSSKSPNWLYYSLSSDWYVRTSISSL